MDLGTFLAATVITDVRAALVFVLGLPVSLHGWFHNTYLGAFAVAVVFAGCVLLFARRFPQTAHQLSSQPDSVKAVVGASVAGAWLHTTLDAFLHPHMRPFYPLPGNPLYELTGDLTISEDVIIYGVCMLAFLLAVGMIGLSAVWRRWQTTGT